MKTGYKLSIILGVMLLISCSMTMASEWDNVKSYTPPTPESKYGTITITNWLGLGSTLADYKLLWNTDICFEECNASIEVKLYSKGSILNNMEYNSLKVLPASIHNAQISLAVNKMVEFDVNDYKEECGINRNGTYACINKVIGTHKESELRKVKVPYNNEELESGTYELRIDAYKGHYDKVDWVANALGVRMEEWQTWVYGDIGYGLNYFWALNNSLVDNEGRITLTNTGGCASVAGKLGQAFNITGNGQELNTNYATTINTNSLMNNSGTWQFWIKYNSLPIGTGVTYYNDWNNFRMNYGGHTYQWAMGQEINIDETPSINTWYHLILTWDINGSASIWINGTKKASITYYDGVMTGYGGETYRFGKGSGDGYYSFEGVIDEIGLWNRTLTDTEIVTLYNSGSGRAYPFTIPNVKPNTPKPEFNNYIRYSTDNLNCSAIISDSEADDMTAYFNLTINNAFVAQHYLTLQPSGSMVSWWISNGNYSSGQNVSCWLTLNDGTSFSTTNTTSTTILSSVLTQQNEPVNNYNTTNPIITFNCSAESLSGNLANISLWISGTLNYTASQTSSTGTLQKVMTMPQGNGTWYCKGANSEDTNTTTTRLFSLDSIVPQITITNYSSSIFSTQQPVYTIINWSITDTNFFNSWIYNGTNLTAGCSATGVCGLQIPLSSEGAYTFIIYANDSFGNINSTSLSLYFYYINGYITENKNYLLEEETNILTLYVNMTDINVTNAVLIWNNTNKGQGVRTKTASKSYRFVNTFTIPVGVGNNTPLLITYYWKYNITGVINDVTIYDNQTITSITLDNCTLGSIVILNYTLKDEKTRETILSEYLPTIELDVNIYSIDNPDISWNFSKRYNSTNAKVCLSNISNYNLYSTALYYANEYESEYNYIEGYNLNSTNIPSDIFLYDLLANTSTTFLVNFQDSNYVYKEGVIIRLDRYYVSDGEFISVEHGKTDSDGNTYLHFVEESVIYRIYAFEGQTLLWASPDYQVLCQTTPCTLNLRQPPDSFNLTNFTHIGDLYLTATLDEDTRTISIDYLTADGSSAVMLLNVTKITDSSNYSECYSTDTSSSGSLICSVATSSGNSTYIARVYKNGILVKWYPFTIGMKKAFESFGYTGIILTALLFLTLTLMGISSPTTAIVTGILGLGFAIPLSLINGGSILGSGATLLYVIVAGVILIIKISNRKGGG